MTDISTQIAEIKWGIVGCGDVTEVKSGPGFRNADNSELVAVMRRDGAKAADYAKRHDVAKSYDTVEDLVSDADVSAIYVATPTAAHLGNVLVAAKTGKPIFVEKPMGLDTAECDEMIAACEASGSVLIPAFYRRALPRFERFREIAMNGQIGTPRCVSVRHFMREEDMPKGHWKTDPTVNGGGIFVDMQTHTIDWLDHAFGPAISVSGVASNQSKLNKAEDTVSASMMFGNGVVANFLCCYAADHAEENVTIIGDKGTVSMSFFALTPIRLATEAGVEMIEVADPKSVHQPLIQGVVDYLNGGTIPVSTAQSGRRATVNSDAILGAYRASHG